MTTQELSNDQLDNIIGGAASYMDKLAAFINTGDNGPYFTFRVNKEIGASTVSGGGSGPANDKTMNRIIERAEQYGSVTFYGPNGNTTSLTAAQLRAMM